MTANDGPANTTMMGVVHDALRRDIARLEHGLGAGPRAEDRRRQALADHIDWMTEFLHHHHQGEDTGLWPMVRQHNASAGPVLDKMQVDHAAVAPLMDVLQEANRRYRIEDSDGARTAVAASVANLAALLLPHLRDEEEHAMPMVLASITNAEWKAWDQRNNVRGKSLGRLGVEAHWLMDELDAERRDLLLHLVPAPVRVVIVKGYARRYRVGCALRWGSEVSLSEPTR